MEQSLSFWRLPRVVAETGFARSTVYRLIETGQFPRPVKIGERATAWIADEVRGWMADRVEASRRQRDTATA